jgi:hypothetical protein
MDEFVHPEVTTLVPVLFTLVIAVELGSAARRHHPR